MKVIGLHKGKYKDDNIIKFCLGIPINLIIVKIKSIQSICKIDKEHIGKEIIIKNKNIKLDDNKNKKNLNNTNKTKKHIKNNNIKDLSLQVLVLGSWYKGVNKVMNSSFFGKTVEYLDYGQHINFHIWAPSCSEKYRFSLSSFYRDTYAIIFVFNSFYLFSFKTIKDLYKHVKEYCPGKPILIVYAYKTKFNLDNFLIYGHVSEEEAEEFAKEIGAILIYEYDELCESGLNHLLFNIGKKYLEEEEKKEEEKKEKEKKEKEKNAEY